MFLQNVKQEILVQENSFSFLCYQDQGDFEI
jgi:hypothetical protein